MSSAAKAVPVDFATTRVPSFEFDLSDLIQEEALPSREGSDFAGRSFVALDDAQAQSVSRAYEAGVGQTATASLASIAIASSTLASITEHQDGTARIIQKSYWSQGICIGIYYLCQYWFSLDSKSRVVMDAIYSAVKDAVEAQDDVNITALAQSILSASSDDAVIQEFLETHFDMVQHAFGYTRQSEELLLALHTAAVSMQRKEVENLRFLHGLVRHIVGEPLLAEAANDLLPQSLRSKAPPRRTCYEYLHDFVGIAKTHPLYNKLQVALGEDPECAELIASRALAMIKQSQIDYINWLQASGQLTDGGVGLRSDLAHTHNDFDRFLTLYSTRNQAVKKVLADLTLHFERDATGFAMFATFVRENKITLKHFVENSQAQLIAILGMGDFEKLKALLQLIEHTEDHEQYLLVIQKILEQFSKQEAALSTSNGAEFFTSLEHQISAEDWVMLIDVSSHEFLGEACFQGYDLIERYLGPNIALIRGDLIYWSILAKLLGVNANQAPNEGDAWSEKELASRMDPLIARFSLEPLLIILNARSADFNRICGAKNVQTLLAYLEGLRQVTRSDI